MVMSTSKRIVKRDDADNGGGGDSGSCDDGDYDDHISVE